MLNEYNTGKKGRTEERKWTQNCFDIFLYIREFKLFIQK